PSRGRRLPVGSDAGGGRRPRASATGRTKGNKHRARTDLQSAGRFSQFCPNELRLAVVGPNRFRDQNPRGPGKGACPRVAGSRSPKSERKVLSNMSRINEDDLEWEEQVSPKRKFGILRKNLSQGVGGKKDTGSWGGGHPF